MTECHVTKLLTSSECRLDCRYFLAAPDRESFVGCILPDLRNYRAPTGAESPASTAASYCECCDYLRDRGNGPREWLITILAAPYFATKRRPRSWFKVDRTLPPAVPFTKFRQIDPNSWRELHELSDVASWFSADMITAI